MRETEGGSHSDERWRLMFITHCFHNLMMAIKKAEISAGEVPRSVSLQYSTFGLSGLSQSSDLHKLTQPRSIHLCVCCDEGWTVKNAQCAEMPALGWHSFYFLACGEGPSWLEPLLKHLQ